jgi:uncharacterized protein with PIN domain
MPALRRHDGVIPETGPPSLFKGNDFGQTDITPAIAH